MSVYLSIDPFVCVVIILRSATSFSHRQIIEIDHACPFRQGTCTINILQSYTTPL